MNANDELITQEEADALHATMKLLATGFVFGFLAAALLCLAIVASRS